MSDTAPKRIAVADHLQVGSGFAGGSTQGLIISALELAGLQVFDGPPEQADALITLGESGSFQPQESDDPRPHFLIDPVLTAEAASREAPALESLSGIACCFAPKAAGYVHLTEGAGTALHLPPFIDPAAFLAAQRDAASLRKSLSQRYRLPLEDRWIFLSVTQDTREESLIAGIESLSRLFMLDWSLVVHAVEETRPLVEALLPRLSGTTSHLLEGNDPAEKRAFLTASDLFLALERSGTEVTDLLEALAAGLAVVASKDPVIEEVIQNGVSGRLSLPGNPASLVNNLTFLLRHDNFLQSHRENSRNQMIARHDVMVAAGILRNLIVPDPA